MSTLLAAILLTTAAVGLWSLSTLLGRRPPATGEGRAETTGACGDTLEIGVRLVDGRVISVSHRSDGCAHGLSAVMAAAQLARDRTPEEIRSIDAHAIIRHMGTRGDDDHRHCACQAAELLQTALSHALGRPFQNPPGSGTSWACGGATEKSDLRRRILTAVFFLISPALLPGGYADPAAAALSVVKEGKQVSLTAENTSLGDVLAEVRRRWRVEFYGLEGRAADAVTFSVDNESVEKAVKRLLRYLNEDNYVLVYTRTRLKIVSVTPGGGGRPVATAPPVTSGAGEKADLPRMSAVRILRISPDSQAAELDLQAGDLVVEYDGRAVSTSRQLVRMVKARTEADTVEMMVYRDGRPIRQILRGGLIGINVANTRVPPEQIGREAGN